MILNPKPTKKKQRVMIIFLTWCFIHQLKGFGRLYGEKNLWSPESKHKTKTAETAFYEHCTLEKPSKSIPGPHWFWIDRSTSHTHFQACMYRLAYLEKQIKSTHLKDHLVQNGVRLTSPCICHLSGIRYIRRTMLELAYLLPSACNQHLS